MDFFFQFISYNLKSLVRYLHIADDLHWILLCYFFLHFVIILPFSLSRWWSGSWYVPLHPTITVTFGKRNGEKSKMISGFNMISQMLVRYQCFIWLGIIILAIFHLLFSRTMSEPCLHLAELLCFWFCLKLISNYTLGIQVNCEISLFQKLLISWFYSHCHVF